MKLRLVDSPDFWWPTLPELARYAMKAVGYALVAWLLYAAGEAHMAGLEVRAINDADFCLAEQRKLLGIAERAARALGSTDADLAERLRQRVPTWNGMVAWGALLEAHDEVRP
jgi:hypothetical protein